MRALLLHLLCSLLLVLSASAQTRVLSLKAGRNAAEATALTAYRANPLTLRITLDATRPTATGLETLSAEIRSSQTDTAAPLAAVILPTPTGAGPFDLTFSGAQLNQSLGGKASAAFWLVIYSTDDSGETLDIWHAGKFTLLEHAASQVAAAPPNVVGPLSRAQGDALYATLATITSLNATIASLTDRIAVLEAGAAGPAPVSADNITITADSITITADRL